MATVNIVFVKPNYLSNVSTVMSASGVLASENITSSAVSQQSVALTEKCVCRVTVTGGNVYVRLGTNPTAAAGDDFLILDGQTEVFGVPENYKVAVINA